MGLLDELVKAGSKAVEELSTDENKELVNNLINAVKNEFGEAAEGIKQGLEELKAEQEKKVDVPVQMSEAVSNIETTEDESCQSKLEKVLSAEFPQYAVKKNVSPTTIGGTGRFMNYTYGIYDGETPKLFIMVIGKTTCTHREYKWSKAQAKAAGVEMINFIEHYPNELGYIAARLHRYI